MLFIKGLSAQPLTNMPAWKKPTPTFDQKYDWLRLTSDEWFKGDIISLYDDELEFDSKEFDNITFDWEDVAELRSRFDKSIRLTSGEVVEGFLIIKNGEVTILSQGEAKVFPLSELMTITSSAEQRTDLWTGNFNLGIQVSQGNTDKIEYNLTSDLQRRTPLTRFRSDFTYNFSETKNSDDQYITTTDNRRLTSYFDWFYTAKIFFRLVDFEHTSDKENNLTLRNTLGSALGYHLVDSKRTTWDVTTGPSYQISRYTSPNRKESSVVWAFDTLLEYEISSKIDYIFDYQLQFVNEASGERIHYLKTGLSFDLVNDIDIDVSFVVDRVAKPVPTTNVETPDSIDDIVIPEKNDYRFIFSFGYTF